MKCLSIAGPLLRSSRHTRLLLTAGFGGLLEPVFTPLEVQPAVACCIPKICGASNLWCLEFVLGSGETTTSCPDHEISAS